MHGQVVEPPRWHVKRAVGFCALLHDAGSVGQRHRRPARELLRGELHRGSPLPWRGAGLAGWFGVQSSRNWYSALEMVNVFLYAPQDFRNLCVVARTLEVLGHRECHVFDPWRLVRERYGKARIREQRVVSAGAFDKVRWHRVEEPIAFLAAQAGRRVATVADASAAGLGSFRFEANDWVLFGSESAGLPGEVVEAAPAKVTIPSRGETQSLNLAVSLGVVLFEAQRQLLGVAGA